jgi:hypothetical protein
MTTMPRRHGQVAIKYAKTAKKQHVAMKFTKMALKLLHG